MTDEPRVSGRASVHFTLSGETPAYVTNRHMLNIGDYRFTLTLSDHRDGPKGVADLLARMIQVFASAPDLTDTERAAVVERLAGAVESVDHRPSVLPPVAFPARVEAEAQTMEAGR